MTNYNTSHDERVWDKGTPFESGPEPMKRLDREDDIVWDRGTPFETRESKNPNNDACRK